MYQAYIDDLAPTRIQAHFGIRVKLAFPTSTSFLWCGVLGVSSDEYLNYDLNNREEWEHMMERIPCTLVAKPNSQNEAKITTAFQCMAELIGE
jgi:hypothetical protein